MKKFFAILTIITLAMGLCGNVLKMSDTKERIVEIYYVDHSMLRLIPMRVELGEKTTHEAANEVIDLIIKGQDFNENILRVIPNIKNCISVKIKNRTAVVNLKEKFVKKRSENTIHGLLGIYQIVNSLVSIEGIDNVKFLVNGKEEKNLIDGIDLRETFIPDYYM